MDIRLRLFERHHGLVRTSELHAIGENDEMIRISRNYGLIVQVRQGWWAFPNTPEPLMRAWEAGGRLACVSAIDFHEQRLDPAEPVHIELPKSSVGPRVAGAVAHWARSPSNGDRRAVSIEVARRQASRCRAATGTL